MVCSVLFNCISRFCVMGAVLCCDVMWCGEFRNHLSGIYFLSRFNEDFLFISYQRTQADKGPRIWNKTCGGKYLHFLPRPRRRGWNWKITLCDENCKISTEYQNWEEGENCSSSHIHLIILWCSPGVCCWPAWSSAGCRLPSLPRPRSHCPSWSFSWGKFPYRASTDSTPGTLRASSPVCARTQGLSWTWIWLLARLSSTRYQPASLPQQDCLYTSDREGQRRESYRSGSCRERRGRGRRRRTRTSRHPSLSHSPGYSYRRGIPCYREHWSRVGWCDLLR